MYVRSLFRIGVSRLLAPALALLLVVSPLVLADETADRAALEATAQAWIKAFNARDVDSLTALVTEDVVLLDPSIAPVSGRKAAQLALQQSLAAARGQIATATKEIVIAGNVAWRIGSIAHDLPKSDLMSRGQSLEIWQRIGGAWKIHRQMSSGILVRPKLLPRPLPSEPILDTPRS